MYESQLSFWGGNTFHAHPILKIGAYSLLSCWSWELGHKRLACQVEKLGFSWRKQGACGSSDTQQTIWEFDVKDDQILTNFNGLDQLRGHWVSIWNEGKDQKDSDSLWSHTFFFSLPWKSWVANPGFLTLNFSLPAATLPSILKMRWFSASGEKSWLGFLIRNVFRKKKNLKLCKQTWECKQGSSSGRYLQTKA